MMWYDVVTTLLAFVLHCCLLFDSDVRNSKICSGCIIYP